MSYYDDFYQEPNEFERQIEELKTALLKSVKSEYKEEMERLRAENEKLQTVKHDWKNIQSEFAAKHRQLENERAQMERKVRSARLGELMMDLNVTLYSVGYHYVQRPKCNNCNENRQYEFITPSGKQMTENCDCATRYTLYIPTENIMSEMVSRDGKITAWYKTYRDSDDGLELSSSTMVRKIYESGTPFESLERYGLFFRSKEECQAYCDWLNAKEQE
ncbi:hypothetical protein YDYSY3_57640 [Paenibacillus chitinolyticus]|uniref:hypothetical protein n=1 Tax=Paenibacillus chitinolyticus TaxID=79263 RepID=UPI0026E4B0EE|nr:hypothetical protein [Paenibacillus chitinolyticus]GKS14764.1 hypothetical protein YDYSY3_57640 [Paenibacillus chitinolyticus]